jgi:hypothetical protein
MGHRQRSLAHIDKSSRLATRRQTHCNADLSIIGLRHRLKFEHRSGFHTHTVREHVLFTAFRSGVTRAQPNSPTVSTSHRELWRAILTGSDSIMVEPHLLNGVVIPADHRRTTSSSIVIAGRVILFLSVLTATMPALCQFDGLLANEPFSKGLGVLNQADSGIGWEWGWWIQYGAATIPGYDRESPNSLPITYLARDEIRFGTGYSDVVPPETSLVPPSNLAAVSGDGQINLTWQPSAGASKYTVWQSTAGSFSVVATDISLTSFGLQGLANGVTYSYYVTAANQESTGAASSFQPLSALGFMERNTRPSVRS